MVFDIFFWVLISILLYTYFGYTLLLFLWDLLTRKPKKTSLSPDLPEVTFLIAAYNEKYIALEKVRNTFGLNYPKNKIIQLWVTDGSTDGIEQVLNGIENVKVIHEPIRLGKTAALNRGIKYVKTPITIFSDANTMISDNSISLIINEFQNQKVGCVAGEKRISFNSYDNAASSGEGLYWKYESLIKRLESKVKSTLSAAGELYAIRTELYTPVEEDIILDDFIITSRIAAAGYKIKYIPNAYAVEKASVNIFEEKKRKIRIASGSFQALFRYPSLLNFCKHPFLSFQYLSHKVLRWLFVPISLFVIPILNLLIIIRDPSPLYYYTLIITSIFYLTALVGLMLQNSRIRVKFLFLPYYLLIMNISIIEGFFNYLFGKHNAVWEKSIRQT